MKSLGSASELKISVLKMESSSDSTVTLWLLLFLGLYLIGRRIHIFSGKDYLVNKSTL